jgi:hypothetical protein
MLIDNFTVNPTSGKIWEGFEQSGTPLIPIAARESKSSQSKR